MRGCSGVPPLIAAVPVPSPLAVPWPAPAHGSPLAFPDPNPGHSGYRSRLGPSPSSPLGGPCQGSAHKICVTSGLVTAELCPGGGQSPGKQMPTLGNHPRSPALGHHMPQRRQLCVRSAVWYKARREHLLNIKRRVIPGQKHKRDGVKIGFSPGEKNCLAPVSIHKTRLVLI